MFIMIILLHVVLFYNIIRNNHPEIETNGIRSKVYLFIYIKNNTSIPDHVETLLAELTVYCCNKLTDGMRQDDYTT